MDRNRHCPNANRSDAVGCNLVPVVAVHFITMLLLGSFETIIVQIESGVEKMKDGVPQDAPVADGGYNSYAQTAHNRAYD